MIIWMLDHRCITIPDFETWEASSLKLQSRPTDTGISVPTVPSRAKFHQRWWIHDHPDVKLIAYTLSQPELRGPRLKLERVPLLLKVFSLKRFLCIRPSRNITKRNAWDYHGSTWRYHYGTDAASLHFRPQRILLGSYVLRTTSSAKDDIFSQIGKELSVSNWNVMKLYYPVVESLILIL